MDTREPIQSCAVQRHSHGQEEDHRHMDAASQSSTVTKMINQGISATHAKKRKGTTHDQTDNRSKKACSLTQRRKRTLFEGSSNAGIKDHNQEIDITDPEALDPYLNTDKTNVPQMVKTVSGVMRIDCLNTIRRSKFLKEHIINHCREIKYEQNDDKFQEYQKTVKGITELFKALLSQLPSSCDDIYPTLTVMQMTNQTLMQKKRINDGQLEAIIKLIEQCDNVVESRREKKITVEDVKPPPNDFRKINVYPTAEDLHRRMKPFLRKNKIEGSYVDVDHYLDVHFRLLREDFLRHLVDGIKSYRRSIKRGNREINTDIRVYPAVRIINTVCNNEGLCYKIEFQTKRRRKIQWKYSKRLIFGTLVCLSSDNFESDFIFATVQNRDDELLEQGCLEIRIENTNGQLRKLEPSEQFVMAESTTYFEPYRHVLEGLQGIRSLPFEKYLLRCDKQISSLSYSLPNNSKGISDIALVEIPYNEQTAARENSPSTSSSLERMVLSSASVATDYIVPTISAVQLDETQYKAFQTALTKELALIQGPPGTGKTYVGLKIIRTLLEWHFPNDSLESLFRRYEKQYTKGKSLRKAPILVVCYTNHALDQFLEGILMFTKDIVRIGGRSKCEKLQEKNIRNLRYQRKKESGSNQRCARERVKRVRAELENTIDRLSYVDQGVLSTEVLKEVMLEEHKALFNLDNKNEIVSWLGLYELLTYNDSVRIPRWQQTDQSDSSQQDSNTFDHFAFQRSNHVLDVYSTSNQNEKNPTPDTPVQRVGLVLYIGENFYEPRQDFDLRIQMVYNRWMENQKSFMHAKRQLTKINQTNAFDNITNEFDVWEMHNEERWMLYRFWRERCRSDLLKKKQEYEEEYEDALKKLEDVQLGEDIEILQSTKVLGMTTTGAAKFRKMLQVLRPKVILVEEAAEVLEAHIITTLSTSCEHLILIGDHKQLRPNPAVYDLAENFNLKISLFERLIRNEIPYETLLYQRRMRPEIATLLQNIYPELKNHNSVDSFENIRGVIKNYFFLNHNKEEVQDVDMELNSPSNKHEAIFLEAFSTYLLNQGYVASQITILTPYAGQVKLLQQHMSHLKFREIKISTIDNYQGEENDLVLLSLVRSNKDEKIGFLKDENRLCVSVSRARIGLYVIGNFDLLGSKSQLWNTMVETAKENDCFGTYLPLFCQNHPDDIGIEAQEAEDFKNAPEGGCLKPCQRPLECGHVCLWTCHGYDPEHHGYHCRENCEMIICDTHETKCKHPCFEPCSRCTVPVDRERPECKHVQRIGCGESLNYKQCKKLCEYHLECGHVCPLECHVYYDPHHMNYKCKKPCDRVVCEAHKTRCNKKCFQPCSKCIVPIKKELPGCNHFQREPCGESLFNIQCEKRCEYRLDCGHACSRKCHFYNDPEHLGHKCMKPCEQIVCETHNTKCENQCFDECSKCTALVSKEMPGCNHLQKVPCGKPLRNILCKNSCGKRLGCGHRCPKFCFEQCVQQSACKQFKTVKLKCGHEGKIRCSADPKEVECKASCEATLKCGHTCQGACGKCFSGRLHQSCKSKCTRTLVCDHKCSSFCTHTCASCVKRCENRCSHSRCPKRCGELCPPCREMCNWSCEHKTCTKKCHEPCNRERCDEPCKQNLKCGHRCIGLCGEPCPDKCIVCNKEEVTEIFFGTEEENNARFIQLNECKHIFEISGLDQWMEQAIEGEKNVQIQMKKCPKCSIIIRRSFRYGNIIKKVLKDIELIKSKLADISPTERNARRNNVLAKTTDKKFISLLKRDISYNQLQCLEIVIPLTNHITGKLDKINFEKATNQEADEFVRYLRFQFKQLEHWAKRERNRLSEQERSEAQLEIDRLDSYFEPAVMLRKVEDRRIKLSDAAVTKLQCIKSELFMDKALEQDSNAISELKAAINEQVAGVLNITHEEKLQILQWGEANGLRKGAWYKCPNGHIYTIGECGGAMERSNCPECNAEIGGAQHRLTDGNSVATIMDGARHAAWSDQANMDNYDLGDLV